MAPSWTEQLVTVGVLREDLSAKARCIMTRWFALDTVRFGICIRGKRDSVVLSYEV
jgi:hypothetical protein